MALGQMAGSGGVSGSGNLIFGTNPISGNAYYGNLTPQNDDAAANAQIKIANAQNPFTWQQQQSSQQAASNLAAQQQAANWASQQSAQGFQGQQATQAQQAQTALQGQQIAGQSALQSGQEQFQTGQSALDRSLQSSLATMANTTTQQGQQLQYQAAQLPYQWANQVFGQVFPIIQGLAGNITGAGGAGGAGGAAGAPAGYSSLLSALNNSSGSAGGVGTQPALPNSSVLTPDMIQQQINNSMAANQQSTANQSRALQSKLAGQGYGANSPLLQAMQSGLQSGLLGANANTDLNTRLQAAQANATQANTVSGLGEQQYVDQNQANFNRQQAALNYLTQQGQTQASLINGLLGSIRV